MAASIRESAKKKYPDYDNTMIEADIKAQLAFDKYCIADVALVTVDNLKEAEGDLQVRPVENDFLQLLKENMSSHPLADYIPYAVIVRTTRTAEAVLAQPNRFHYTVVGGNHSCRATKELGVEFPTNEQFKRRKVRIFYNPPLAVAIEVSKQDHLSHLLFFNSFFIRVQCFPKNNLVNWNHPLKSFLFPLRLPSGTTVTQMSREVSPSGNN